MSSESSQELSPDVVFEVLSSRRRRMVLYLLRQDGDTATVNELAEQIASLENDVPVDELTSQQQKRVYVSLYQTHLPKLDQTGIIDYEVDEGVVSHTGKANEVDSYLTQSSASTYPWKLHYSVLAVLSVIISVLWLLSVPGLAFVPILLLATTTVVAFTISGAIQYWQQRKMEQKIPVELRQRR
jgi:hypothetical protein